MEAAMTITPTHKNHFPACNDEKGFTLIEVLVSMVIVTIGLVALLGSFSVAMSATHIAKQDMIAKQLAQEAIESIVTARETANIAWDQIQNVGPGNGIFSTGLRDINQAGPDGVIGTADDATPESIQDPGPDGIMGTGDEPSPVPLTNFKRSIVIGPTASGDLRTVTITVQYTNQRGLIRSYVLSGMVSQYR